MKKKAKKQRFNVIDMVVLVLILIAVAVTAYFFFRGKGIFTKNSIDIEYVVTVQNIPEEFTDNLTENDTIYDQSTSFSIGKIKDIYHESDKDGNTVMTMIVEAKAEKENEIIFVNGVPVYANSVINFRTPDLMYSGICTRVDEKGDMDR